MGEPLDPRGGTREPRKQMTLETAVEESEMQGVSFRPSFQLLRIPPFLDGNALTHRTLLFPPTRGRGRVRPFPDPGRRVYYAIAALPSRH